MTGKQHLYITLGALIIHVLIYHLGFNFFQTCAIYCMLIITKATAVLKKIK